jgi:hypothetical protein
MSEDSESAFVVEVAERLYEHRALVILLNAFARHGRSSDDPAPAQLGPEVAAAAVGLSNVRAVLSTRTET